MSFDTRFLIVNNIKLPIDASFEEAFSVAGRRLARCGINTREAVFSVYRRSTDARRRDDIKFVYSVAVYCEFSKASLDKLKEADITVSQDEILPRIEYGCERLSAPPLIVGSGPCGLFAGLILAENGYNPIIIERGGPVTERQLIIEKFKKYHILDTDTNIQFGAGGAGTFSDGKLVTRINDPISSYVLRRMVDFGAPEEILYLAKPHIGTDILAPLIERVISRITELGGKVLYNTKFINTVRKSSVDVAITNSGEIPYGALLLAIGHSARDTYKNLITAGYDVEAKPFSVGMRIEHLAKDIDYSLYGKFAGHEKLGHAEYNLSYNTKERGVYTFCMCPGGEVVAAASEEGGVVVNGMSAHARAGRNSNSAVVCSIFKEDYGKTPDKAIEFQRNIERAAYLSAGSDYSAPIITVSDFFSNKCITEPKQVIPTYMDSSHTRLTSPYTYLPRFVCDSIKDALGAFDKKIHGFANDFAVLTGAETRTSAPVRILRDKDTRIAPGTKNIYPCGEGAGYAGGITSAAIDGIKTAIAVMNKYTVYKK